MHLAFIFEALTPSGRLPSAARVKRAFEEAAALVANLTVLGTEVVKQEGGYEVKAQARARHERFALLWIEHGLMEVEGASGRAQIMGQRVYTVGSAPPLQA
ncbi:hypothetical protein D3875_02535 [Deinococcus cavernae]|uniref:Uncharacterized protein n=1 Tax=Deinococcus cavernae TaxID=2320857 RepID=A0A418VFJ3_9DEIO|nr:hypothetical protein [Deinococcus cavernae]RJF74890.1 hypothetical protein D3875_02535 [Deinococcus cavernae]